MGVCCNQLGGGNSVHVDAMHLLLWSELQATRLTRASSETRHESSKAAGPLSKCPSSDSLFSGQNIRGKTCALGMQNRLVQFGEPVKWFNCSLSDNLAGSGLIVCAADAVVVGHVRWKKCHGRSTFARTQIPSCLIFGRELVKWFNCSHVRQPCKFWLDCLRC
jgi:hypothetical protein